MRAYLAALFIFKPFQMSEQELLTQFLAFQHGSKDGMAFIYNYYRDRIYSQLYWWTGDDTAAEDLVEDVFYQLMLNFWKIRNIEHLAGHLYLTAMHLYWQSVRRNGYRLQSEREWMRVMEGETQVVEHHWAMIEKAVENLSPKRKDVMKLRFFEGLKTKEIAIRLNMADQTVINTINQSLAILRKNLGKPGDEKFLFSQ